MQKEINKKNHKKIKYPKSELFEKLVDIEHRRWADWQKYMHSKCNKMGLPNENGNYDRIIPADLFLRWEKLIKTSYKDLTEKEKNSDRDQVMRYWNLIKS